MLDNKSKRIYDVEYKFKVNAVDRYEAEREAEGLLGSDEILGKLEVYFSADNYYNY